MLTVFEELPHPSRLSARHLPPREGFDAQNVHLQIGENMKEKIIFALGFFDGVHLGHQALLSACKALAAKHDCQAGVLTFIGHPDTLVLGKTPTLLNTPYDRRQLLTEYGMGTVVELPFDRALMNCPWQDFFHRLVEEFGAAGFVCGEDFRFGYRGEGNAEKLQQLCKENNLPCAVVPQQTLDATVISSTHIRTLISQGNIAEALRFLGHPHILSGKVVSGQKLGRTMGIPTANLSIPDDLLLPKFGVYACRVHTDSGTYLAVTNVGNRPTVGGEHLTVEPWLLDFSGDLYGKEITVEFHAFLRPEKKFPTLAALQEEIQRNKVQTLDFFGKN